MCEPGVPNDIIGYFLFVGPMLVFRFSASFGVWLLWRSVGWGRGTPAHNEINTYVCYCL